MLDDPRVLRAAAVTGAAGVVAAWVLAGLARSVSTASLVALAIAAAAAGHVLLHGARELPAALLTAALGGVCVVAAVTGWFDAGSPGMWLALVVLSLWVLRSCAPSRRTDERHRAAHRR